MKKFALVLVLILSFFALDSVSASALKKAINLSGKQRMLTQKMSKEAVLIALGVDKDAYLAKLKATRDLFDKTLKGLAAGDASLGLEPTKDAAILAQLKVVEGLWGPFDAVVSQIITTKAATKDHIDKINQQNLNLLAEMNKAVKLFEGKAANTGIDKALATAINLSGRQRMLTQKISKEYFLTAYGIDKETNKSNLKSTTSLFDTTLEGLVNGSETLGLKAVTDLNLVIQLGKVRTMWKKLQTTLATDANTANVAAVAKENEPLLVEMNKAVGMFEKLTAAE